MSHRLQLMLIIVSLIAFIFIVRCIKNSKISSDMASIWILWGLGLILISIFPSIVDLFSNLLGIAAQINTVFLIMIFLLYILVFYLYIKISLLESKIKNLIQRTALDNKTLDEKEKESNK